MEMDDDIRALVEDALQVLPVEGEYRELRTKIVNYSAMAGDDDPEIQALGIAGLKHLEPEITEAVRAERARTLADVQGRVRDTQTGTATEGGNRVRMSKAAAAAIEAAESFDATVLVKQFESPTPRTRGAARAVAFTSLLKGMSSQDAEATVEALRLAERSRPVAKAEAKAAAPETEPMQSMKALAKAAGLSVGEWIRKHKKLADQLITLDRADRGLSAVGRRLDQ